MKKFNILAGNVEKFSMKGYILNTHQNVAQNNPCKVIPYIISEWLSMLRGSPPTIKQFFHWLPVFLEWQKQLWGSIKIYNDLSSIDSCCTHKMEHFLSKLCLSWTFSAYSLMQLGRKFMSIGLCYQILSIPPKKNTETSIIHDVDASEKVNFLFLDDI